MNCRIILFFMIIYKIIKENKESEMINIRNEEEKDFQEVEAITRKAFYNLYIL